MTKMENGSLCPKCGEGKVNRIRRKPWMRHLSKSKYYRCEECRARFLTIFGWAIRLPKKPAAEERLS